MHLATQLGAIYEYPQHLTSWLVQLIRRDFNEKHLNRVLDYFLISIDNARADRFDTIVYSGNTTSTLREFAKSLPSDSDLALSKYVKSVSLDRTGIWSCTPSEFYQNVIMHYKGLPHMWPHHETLKKDFLNMPLEQQLINMTIVDDFFDSNPSKHKSVTDFLNQHRKNLGTVKVELYDAPESKSSLFNQERSQSLLQKIDALQSLTQSLSTTCDLEPLKSRLFSLNQSLQSLKPRPSDYDTAEWHHLWILSLDSDALKLAYFQLSLSQARTTLKETYTRLQDEYKILNQASESSPELVGGLQKILITYKQLLQEIDFIAEWGW